MLKKQTKTVQVGGQTLTFETGRIARQTDGAVLVHQGDTVVFASACMAPETDASVDFIPLRVDYQETFSSAGKSLSGFIKRQGRPTEKEILVSRLIDRPIRPMFEDGFFTEVQLLSYVWSYDGIHTPEPLAICAASAALAISPIPLIKPIGAVRVGMVNGEFVINPTLAQQKESRLDLLMAGTEDAILMIEGFCDFLTEEQVIEALSVGHTAIRDICLALSEWQKEVGKEKDRSQLRSVDPEAFAAVEKIVGPELPSIIRIVDKLEREQALSTLKKKMKETLVTADGEPKYNAVDTDSSFKKISAQHMRRQILEENVRCDGRNPKEVRQIDVEQSVLPRTHGSSLFTRGETQSLATCTLGGESMAQRYEDLDTDGHRRFYLQYFFPPYSVGEVGRVGTGRREIGHGKLAERALQYIVPELDSFPYTIRLESNITESNGSSSMASVCGGCLAMMDAGIPIRRPVSGIAMGLVLEGDQFVILSDILGIEDALGDMDFKITGDHEGITAFQMDIKVEGITPEIMVAALAQAKEGRVHILQKMLDVCPEPRKEMADHAPRIETVYIRPSKIATIIGPGGKQIRAIIEHSGAEIDINDEGRINIASSSLEGIQKAKGMIEALTAEVEIGRAYTGVVKSIVAFGCFVEILPEKVGLCHISEFDTERIENLDSVVKVGDELTVKVLDINERGQIKLSRKAALLR